MTDDLMAFLRVRLEEDTAAVWLSRPCPTLRHLAAVYDDHPDYQEAWRP